MPVNVTSEIGRLRDVLVHTPGPELLAVTPDTREDYLYDDIIDLETARRDICVLAVALCFGFVALTPKLERTRRSFKSRELGQLRRRLIELLERLETDEPVKDED